MSEQEDALVDQLRVNRPNERETAARIDQAAEGADVADDASRPPIQSRRASVIERLACSIPDRALTVGATLLVVLGGLAAWRSYAEWRLGRV